LLDILTSEELSEWEAYNRLEPITGGQHGALGASYVSKRKKEQSVEEMKQKIFQFVRDK
jgi:hypothetical protein